MLYSMNMVKKPVKLEVRYRVQESSREYIRCYTERYIIEVDKFIASELTSLCLRTHDEYVDSYNKSIYLQWLILFIDSMEYLKGRHYIPFSICSVKYFKKEGDSNAEN